MTIVGFNFTRMLVEKQGNVGGKININNNISLSNIKEMEVNLGQEGNRGLLIKFDYLCSYEPKMGKINLQGDVITLESLETIKKCVEIWSKSKAMDKKVMEKVMPYILNKCNVQAIILSRDAALPSPVPLPKIGAGKEGKDADQADKPVKPADKPALSTSPKSAEKPNK